MTVPANSWLRERVRELRVALQFTTRLPLGIAPASAEPGPDLAGASWALPLAGLVVGGIGALVYWLGFALGLAPLLCAVPAVAATILVTGALHEDGLADTADGFGGGTARERKLAIMRDSRTGTYGACALILSLLLRVAALAVLAEPALVATGLIAAHVAARAPLPLFLRLVPPARVDGLSAGAGRPDGARASAAMLVGAVALALLLAPVQAVLGAILLAAVFAGTSWLTMRQIGGQTGDVAGALEQAGEVLLLVIATA